ncbi:TPR repeat-containing protein YrrB [Rosistilla carotiformis]|uniref:TPR repeat-containing protein YrrB n=1 Tax=Rosistilla carotiformis TaxID=2528017 RepID=A0A518JZR0_9BACT|nr:tetratricopeptide repeat protein [Rosistilla carotiformis]QDV71030.1 TPR repeat-containing protein YrrB [Rosistilla carotiformis]
MSNPKYRMVRTLALLVTSFVLGSLFASLVFAQEASEPVVARAQMQLQVGDKLVDTIEKGDLLTVLEDRGENYLIVTYNGHRGVVAKVNAVKIIESADIYTELIQKNPTDGRLYTLRASAWWALKQHQKALDDFDRAINLGYDAPHAYSSRGMFHAAMGDFDEAIKDYTTALERDTEKEDFSPLLNRAAVYMTLQNFPAAITDYDEVILRKPDLASAYQQRAVAHKLNGDLEKAVSDFDQAIELSPKNVSALMSRGFVHFQQSDHARAVEDFAAVIAIEPRAAAAYNNRGFNLQKLGKTVEALADYNKAIELAPDYALAYQNKAWLLVTANDPQLGNASVAIEAATKAGELNNFAIISDLAAMAAALAADEQFEEAIGWQEKVLEMAAEDRKPYAEKVLALYQDHKPFDPKLADGDASKKDAKEDGAPANSESDTDPKPTSSEDE